jgi:cell division protein FtsQ
MTGPGQMQDYGRGERPQHRWGWWLFMPLIVCTFAIFVFSHEWKKSLKLRHVEVEGLHALSVQEITALTRVPMGTPLFDVDLAGAQQRIAANPFVKFASVTRQYPDLLSISIQEREPIATVNGGQVWYIDASGVLMPFRQSALKLDLPIISGVSGVQNAKAGEVVADKEIAAALEILHEARAIDSSLYHFISEINMNHGGDITLFSVDAGAPIIFGRGDALRKLYLLQAFWQNVVKVQGPEKLQSIDLRFEDQVVAKWNQQTDKQASKVAL